MVDYELSRRLPRSLLGPNLITGEVYIGEIPSSISIISMATWAVTAF